MMNSGLFYFTNVRHLCHRLLRSSKGIPSGHTSTFQTLLKFLYQKKIAHPTLFFFNTILTNTKNKILLLK